MAQVHRPLLDPLSLQEQRDLAVYLLNYFAHLATARRKPPSPGEPIRPSSLGEAWAELPDRLRHVGLWPNTIADMAQRLVNAGMLTHAGTSSKGSPPLDACYYSRLALTKLESRGEAWLTQVLGWNHLLRVAGPQVVQIVGHDDHGTERCGSGFLCQAGVVVTNQHVVEDMTPVSVEIGETSFAISRTLSHPQVDVGLVFLSDGPTPKAGVTFRESRPVEPVLVAGFPPVPYARKAVLTAQTGETCAEPFLAYDGQRQLLFSAISRPGNSGGPLFARDGRVVGIVSRSLEHARAGDESVSHPFFAAVPAAEVRAAVLELEPSLEFPWETWE